MTKTFSVSTIGVVGIVLAILLLGGHQASAAGAFVQNIGTATKNANPNANISVTVPASGVAAGNTIIVSFGASTVAGTPSCADSKGNTYNVDVTRINGSTGRVTICSAPVVTALVAGDTITASYPSFSGGSSISANEFSGLLSVSPLDQTASAAANNNAPNSGATAVTTQADELLFGAFVFGNNNSPTVTQYGAGYTQTNPAITGGIRNQASAYQVVAATGAYSASITLSSAQQWAAAIATYKAAAAPVDVCPNVPGDQASGPCADEVCEDDGGTWDGDSCEFPPGEATLTLAKVVTNDNNGDADESDFQGYIDGNAVAWDDPQTLDTGTYVLSEDGANGYTPSNWDCEANDGGGGPDPFFTFDGVDTITLEDGDDVTCTITNDDIPASITLIKDVTNNNDGTADADDFGLTIGGTPVSSGGSLDVDSNTPIAIDEAGLAGYTFVEITGDVKCPATLGGTVTLDEGESITCTIKNDDDAPPPPSEVTVTIVKYIEGVHASAANANSLAFPMASCWNAANIGAGCGSFALSTVGFNNPNPYEATTSDMSNGANYSAEETLTGSNVGASCSEGKPFALVGYTVGNTEILAAAQEPSLTAPSLTNITSDKFIIVWNQKCEGTLVVQKVLINDSGGSTATTTFSYKVNNGSSVAFEADGQNSAAVLPGSYSVVEDAAAGYTTTYSNSVNGNANCNSLNVPDGGTVTCTITNNDIIPPPPANACNTPTVAPLGYTLVLGTTGSDIRTIAPFTMFVGRGGSDQVTANQNGNYIVCTLGGSDIIKLNGNGDFTISAGEGTNIISTKNGNGTIIGGSGADTITTGDGVQTITMGNGTNTLTTGNGDKTVTGGTGADKVTTGSGNDTISVGSGVNNVSSGGGNDTITGGANSDTFNGGSGTDTCSAGGGINFVSNCEA